MKEINQTSSAKLAAFSEQCSNLEFVMYYGQILSAGERLNRALLDAKFDLQVDVSFHLS